jgi:ferric-dicitrate binding protein FerR (iron transport regulator)
MDMTGAQHHQLCTPLEPVVMQLTMYRAWAATDEGNCNAWHAGVHMSTNQYRTVHTGDQQSMGSRRVAVNHHQVEELCVYGVGAQMVQTVANPHHVVARAMDDYCCCANDRRPIHLSDGSEL